MMSSADGLVLINAVACFVLFVIIQFFVFRRIGEAEVLRSIMNIFMLVGIVNMGVSFDVHSLWGGFSFLRVLVCAVVSFGVYGLLCLLYILGIYGPYESSVRLRLVREFYKVHPQSLTQEELLKRYNAKTILKRRLERMVYSGDLVLEGKNYRLKKTGNFFLVFHAVSSFLEKALTRTP
jgi:hypothetical protein